MDIPQITSPPAIEILDHNASHDRCRPFSRSAFASSSMSSGRRPVPIPNRPTVEAPPPLPPPQFLEDIANGHDIGWTIQNSGPENSYERPLLAPIKPEPSPFGGSHSGSFGRLAKEYRQGDQSDSGKSNYKSKEGPRSLGELLKSASSSTSEGGNYGLQGERPLAQQSAEYSSNAYDKHLLAKIGKPNSPPRLSSLGSIPESSRPTAEVAPDAADGSRLSPLSVTEASTAGELPSKWITSPSSTTVSPKARYGYRDPVEYRSPSVESSAPSAMDIDYYSRFHDGRRGSTSRSFPATEENVSLPSRSKRGSYDQAFLGDADADYPSEETGAMRHLNIRDRTPPRVERRPSYSMQGVKRRASSPPPARESSREERSQAQGPAHDLFNRVPVGQFFPRSPNTRFHPNHGSVSSTASSMGLRHGSYASSAGLSAGGSSMTSVSSFGRHSPRAASPSSDLDVTHESPYLASVSLNASPHNSISASRSTPHSALSEVKLPYMARKIHGQPPSSLSGRSGVQRMGGLFICECCPKKPKKFESAEDLRAHEMEKQYICQFCKNRFKNKNEAERHQNSLHLRRHSWSCAAIASPEAAFHSSTSHKHQTPNGPSADTCGYCGEDFPNFPQRNWDARFDHLTTVHKFAECNHSKKFFRADHFRQHLKHSHGGTSGKWTNMLENACMRDEPPAEPPTGPLSGVGSDFAVHGLISSGGGPGPATSAVHAGYGSGVMRKTIDERQDES